MIFFGDIGALCQIAIVCLNKNVVDSVLSNSRVLPANCVMFHFFNWEGNEYKNVRCHQILEGNFFILN